jgi:FlaG/FlaF family flagellin (archaellin)
MGAAAVPIMVATTVASTAAGVYSAQRSASLAASDARARGRQAASQAREEEISRLDLFSQVASENTARMAAGGLAQEGTLAQITEGNISTMEEDTAGIRATGASQQAYYNQAASNAKSQGNLNSFTALLQGAGQGMSAYNAYQNTALPSGSGSVTGTS